MKTITIGELKMHLSEVLEEVRRGETIVISQGRKNEKVAALIPFHQLESKPRQLGVLEGRAQFCIADEFSLADDDWLNS